MINDSINFKEVFLERFKSEMQIRLPRNLFNSLRFQNEEQIREIAMYIQHSFMGEKRIKEVDVEFTYSLPTSVWQHFKERYFPEILLQHFPVKTEEFKEVKTIQLERYFVFPDVYSENQKIFGRYIIQDLDYKIK